MDIGFAPYSSKEHQPFVLGTGPIGVLWIHGFLGTPAEVRDMADALALNETSNHGILLPGFGKDIDRLGEVTYADWLEAAESAWNVVRSDHLINIIIGYSMGGAIAIHLAVSQPPDALILVAPYWKAPGILHPLVLIFKHVLKEIRPFQFADFKNRDTRRYLESTYTGLDLDSPTGQKYAKKNFMIPLSSVDEVLKLGKNAYSKVSQITCPTLILQGEQDKIVRPDDTQIMVNQIPKNLARYIELSGGHALLDPDSASNKGVIELVQKFIHHHFKKSIAEKA